MRPFKQLSLLTIAVWILCGGGTPSSVSSGSVVNDPNGNFHFYVSNQSFAISPVDVKVSIDERRVVLGYFKVGDQQTIEEFVFRLSPGRHKLVAISSKGGAKLEQFFEVQDKAWASLAYWYHPEASGGAGPYPRHFSLDVSEKPIHFM